MNETIFNSIPAHGIPWIIGGILAVSLLAIYLLSWIAQWSWAWMDDAKTSERNKLMDFIMLDVRKFKERKDVGYVSCFPYEKGSEIADGMGTFLALMAILFFIPAIIVYLWELVLFILCLILLANVVRFSRRHKKLFDEHLNDKKAHK